MELVPHPMPISYSIESHYIIIVFSPCQMALYWSVRILVCCSFFAGELGRNMIDTCQHMAKLSRVWCPIVITILMYVHIGYLNAPLRKRTGAVPEK